MSNDSNGGLPTLASLSEKYRLKADGLRNSGNINLSVRIRRSLSWAARGQTEMEREYHDDAFIFHWIGFEALYAEQRHSSHRAAKTERDEFLRDAVGAGKNAIYNRVIASESETILLLIVNAYVFKSFWNRYYDEREAWWNFPEWGNSLLDSVEQAITALEWGETGTLGTLVILFDRLYELRNQLIHGGATWGDCANRDQVGDGAMIMSRLLPVFLDLAMEHPDRFNNSDVASPPPELDTPEIKTEHNDYVLSLAKMAKDTKRDDYRAYLRKAVERELEGNEDQDFVASVREILYN